jgi:hypothetical protein
VSERPGRVRGQHYSTFAPEVAHLVKLKKLRIAELLLLELIEASEAESRIAGLGVASWYYEQLADVYCAQGDAPAELAILVRFRKQRGTPSDMRRPLLLRLRTLTARGIRVGVRAAPPAGPETRRTCALAGCHVTLAPTQLKYCCVAHHLTAQRQRHTA